MNKFTVFDPMFNNEELENEFHKFFYSNNLSPLFTNEHRTSPIKVTYIDARSVTNNGSYASQLKDFSDILSIANSNQRYEEATFRILHKASTFQKMMNNIKKVLEEYRTTDPKFLFNFWNIVYYNKDLF